MTNQLKLARKAIETITEISIAALDAIDGDPDLEADDHPEDDDAKEDDSEDCCSVLDREGEPSLSCLEDVN